MSIARAFTTRRKKESVDMRDGVAAFPQRSNTTAKGGVSIRNKISAPVELIHTTNMLSYNAPDLFPKSSESSQSSQHNQQQSISFSPSTASPSTDDESDGAPTTAGSTPPTSPDSPFPADKRAGVALSSSPEPNHLSCYFTAPTLPAPVTAIPNTETGPPTIPQRAPSHTKKSYEGLTRHRSASRLSEQSTRSVSTKASFTFSRSSSSSTATSTSSHASMGLHSKPSLPSMPPTPVVVTPASPPPPPVSSHRQEYSESHPFGHELAQVSELAEEYASSTKEDDAASAIAREHKPRTATEEEELELLSRGLRKFSAEDYLAEIRGLAAAIFAETARPMAAVWI